MATFRLRASHRSLIAGRSARTVTALRLAPAKMLQVPWNGPEWGAESSVGEPTAPRTRMALIQAGAHVR